MSVATRCKTSVKVERYMCEHCALIKSDCHCVVIGCKLHLMSQALVCFFYFMNIIILHWHFHVVKELIHFINVALEHKTMKSSLSSETFFIEETKNNKYVKLLISLYRLSCWLLTGICSGQTVAAPRRIKTNVNTNISKGFL